MARILLVWAGVVSRLLVAESYNLPSSFDLRDVSGQNFVSSVKSQSGGTCWTYGTMAAVESNLMLTGVWVSGGESGEPNLAEYHLDWWNGFNRHFNADIAPSTGGLTVHQGGDYRVAAAYLARGGAVRDVDGQSYNEPPAHHGSSFHHYYVRDIEWLSAGPNLERIDVVKQAIMGGGVLGTALAWSKSFFSSSKATFYQPVSSEMQPNHAVSIVGWDDNKVTQAPKPGAWLVKNSWGSGWGQNGYFWISYYDKVAGQHPEMGAVSFRNLERFRYENVYLHDYHGWRDTKKDATEAFNKFVAKGALDGRELLKAVSFYTAADDVSYTIKAFDSFDGSALKDELAHQEGVAKHAGFHTVDLQRPAGLSPGDDFYVYLKLSHGGHPFDKTSNVPVLLCGSGRPMVPSKAAPRESYYRSANGWADLTSVDTSANFCMKALTATEYSGVL